MERQDLVFRVFVSSTFSDMIVERNALQEHVFPELRKYCQGRGARFQAIDLRWGVGQEAALDQQTMNICIRELRRCQQLSPRPNFIVLLGDRYGWRPLPPQIDAREFDSLLAPLTKAEQDRLLARYHKDENADPPEYCLLPRTGEFVDTASWSKEEAELRAILLKAVEQVLSADAAVRRKYDDSATHQEIRHGALEVENPRDHVFCYFREIEGLPVDDRAAQFRDICGGAADTEARSSLDRLKEQLRSLLPRENVLEYSVPWDWVQARNLKDVPPPDLKKEQDQDLSRLCTRVRENLQQIIDDEVASFKRRPDADREAQTHREFAEDRSRHFVGRQDILGRIAEYLASDDNKPLIIHGKSGSGKTALMAKAWLGAAKDKQAVACFIGATPASCDLRSLLTDLCRRMGVADVPSDMNELVKTFRDRLSPSGEGQPAPQDRPPVVLFLDALDQLNPTDNARMLYWLPRELAPGVKLVLSVLERGEAKDKTKPAARDDCFDLAGRIWPGRLVELGGLDEASGTQLLGTWLAEAGRKLQPEQRADVMGKFRACPLPLFLKLAFEEARRWRSWDGLPRGTDAIPGLSDSIDGVLGDLFHRLEEPRNHGPLLVGRALGYIAAGKNGLTEDELLDVLSADEDVMEWFYSQSPTEQAKRPEVRLPRGGQALCSPEENMDYQIPDTPAKTLPRGAAARINGRNASVGTARSKVAHTPGGMARQEGRRKRGGPLVAVVAPTGSTFGRGAAGSLPRP